MKVNVKPAQCEIDGKKINYDELSVNLQVKGLPDFKLVFPNKTIDKNLRTLLIDNIDTAEFKLNTSVSNGIVYCYPVIDFKVGNKVITINLKLKPVELYLVRVLLGK